MSAESTDDEACEFPFDLRIEISKALSSYLQHGESSRERLHKATQRVCTEAHRLALSPEQVVSEIKRLFERMPLSGDGDIDRRRAAWEEFAQGCISAYYNAGDDE